MSGCLVLKLLYRNSIKKFGILFEWVFETFNLKGFLLVRFIYHGILHKLESLESLSSSLNVDG